MTEPAADWPALAVHPEVARLLESGECIRQLEFSYLTGGRLVRGRIDGLVHQPDGSIVVIAGKTGAASSGDPARLDLYVRAAREMFPGVSVTGLLVSVG